MKNKVNGRRRAFTLIEILIVVAIIGILLAIATPAFQNARTSSKAKACQSNLKNILSAKERWAMDTNKSSTDVPANGDLAPYYVHSTPVCPEGGTYTLGTLREVPVCSLGGTRGSYDAHVLP